MTRHGFSHSVVRHPALAGLLASLVGVAISGHAQALDGTWITTTSGSLWGTTGNWQGGIVGTGTAFTATFAPDIASDVEVVNNQQRALGSMIFGTVGGTNSGNWLVSGSQVTVTNGNPALNATITVNSLGSATISSVIAAGTANNALLVKNGAGKLILTNTSNSIGNKISIAGGTLELNNERVLGATPGSYTADQLQLSNGGTFRTTATATISANRGITVGSGGGTISANGGGLALATRVSGAGNTLAVTGANAVTLTNSAVGTNVNWDFAANSGVRTFFEGANALGTGTVTVRNGVRLTSQNMTSGTIANAVTLDSGAGLTARSSGAAQTYTSVTFPSSGSIVLNKDDQTTSNITITSGRELTGILTVSTEQGGANAVGSVFLDGVFSGAGGLTKSGTGASGRVVLRGANTYAGNTTINTGTLQLGNGGVVGSLSTSSVITGSAGGTLVFNRSDTITSGVDFNSAIIGGINIAQTGSGTVILTASNTIGKTSITNGTLQISNGNQLGAAPASFTADQLTISNGATLRTTTGGISLPTARGVTVGSGGARIEVQSAGNLIVNGRFTGSGETVTVTGSGGFSLGNTANGASNVNWDFAMNSGQRAFFAGSDALGTGTVLVRNGIRLVSQTQAPTNGEVTNAVTLESGAGLSARSTAGAVVYTNVTLPTTGTVTFNRDDQVTAALTIASGRELTGILTVDTSQQVSGTAVGDVTLSGNFSGASGGITKIGTGASGRLILGGSNTYGGNTIIDTGTLALAATSSIANSAVIRVASGATFDVSAVSGGFSLAAGQVLEGTGTVSGDVTSSGTIAPGSSPGTLTFADDLSLGSGSILNFELSGTNTTVGSGINDLSSVLGILTLAGTLNVTETVAGSFLSANEGDSWRIFDYSVSLTNNGLSLGTMPALSSGLSFTIDTSTANQVNLLVTAAVPEPTTIVAAMIGLGGLGLAAARRRRSDDRR